MELRRKSSLIKGRNEWRGGAGGAGEKLKLSDGVDGDKCFNIVWTRIQTSFLMQFSAQADPRRNIVKLICVHTRNYFVHRLFKNTPLNTSTGALRKHS
jgi:hypothetical protein